MTVEEKDGSCLAFKRPPFLCVGAIILRTASIDHLDSSCLPRLPPPVSLLQGTTF